jgi:hypothetical protein
MFFQGLLNPAPDAALMGFFGEAFQIMSVSAAGLFAVAVFIVVWLCLFEGKYPRD